MSHLAISYARHSGHHCLCYLVHPLFPFHHSWIKPKHLDSSSCCSGCCWPVKIIAKQHLLSTPAWPSHADIQSCCSVHLPKLLDNEKVFGDGWPAVVPPYHILHTKRYNDLMTDRQTDRVVQLFFCAFFYYCYFFLTIAMPIHTTGILQRFSERTSQQQLGYFKASLHARSPGNDMPAEYSLLQAGVHLPMTNNTALDALLLQKAENFSIPTFSSSGDHLHHAKDVIVLIFSQGVLQMLKNLLCTMKRLGMVHRVVGIALDVQAYNACEPLGIGCVLSDSFTAHNSTSEKLLLWSDSAYKNMTRAKSRNVLEILKRGYNVFLIDVDIVLFKDPTARLREGSLDWDLQVQTDSLFQMKAQTGEINSGFYYMRSSEWSIRFLTHVWFLGHYFPTLSEQKLWNKLTSFRLASKIGWKVTPLNPWEFCNGHVFFVSVGEKNKKYVRRAFQTSKDPYMVHFNWMIGYDKEKTMKHQGMWYLDPTTGECLADTPGLKVTTTTAHGPSLSSSSSSSSSSPSTHPPTLMSSSLMLQQREITRLRHRLNFH